MSSSRASRGLFGSTKVVVTHTPEEKVPLPVSFVQGESNDERVAVFLFFRVSAALHEENEGDERDVRDCRGT